MLVSPKTYPAFSVFRDTMSPDEYDLYNYRITATLKSKNEELFMLYPRVALCTPSEEYPRALHQYISRLICWKCSPRYDSWTLQMKHLHIGGCDEDYHDFWPEIKKIDAIVEPKFRQHLRNNVWWLKGFNKKPKYNKKKFNRRRY